MNIWKRRNLVKICGIIPLFLFANFLKIYAGPGSSEGTFSENFIYSVFDVTGIWENKSLVIAVENLYFIIYFNLVFGTYIYKHFVKESVYIFSRIPNRKKWFFVQAAKLYGICALYTFLYLFLHTGLCAYRSRETMKADFMEVFLLFFVLFSAVLMISTLCINMFSVLWGSNVGFCVSYIVMLALLELSLHYEKIPGIGKVYQISLCNPMSAMSVVLLEHPTEKIACVLYYQAFITGMVLLCAEKIKRMDLSLHNGKKS